ncbi:MAG: NADH-quinone oxidoreductase subunit NuoG [Desulfobacterales bacterium]
MPKLIIDKREIVVPEGTMVIDAAEQAGIYIPRFCYFAELGAVGACRVCAVMFKEGPFTGLEMSCMAEAEDGMVVSTEDPEAVDFRKYVIEWMMMNHPHDCPVCDEGGHCLLQDLTVAGGHGIRRYPGKKRTYRDQYLGPLISHEENRCIQCYRCSRFYQEHCGYADLGVTGIARRIYFGRYTDGVLENPFSGNLIDICPTGVYTDRPSRYTGRRWDFERSEGVCINCSLGCGIRISARYREIVRLEAGSRQGVNRAFICDRGRYGFFYANSDARPARGRVDGENVSLQKAVDEAVKRLESISAKYGGQAVAAAGSGRSSLETLASCIHMCRAGSFRDFVFEDRTAAPGADAAVWRLTPENAASMESVESADFILAAGADPLNEAPMLALAMRRAQKNGAAVSAIDPRPLAWPFEFTQVSAAPGEIEQLLEELNPETPSGNHDARHAQALDSIKDRLEKSSRPVVVCGTEIIGENAVSAAADLVDSLRGTRKDAGIFFLLPRANTRAGVLLDKGGGSATDLVGRMESGEIRALVMVESDLADIYPDRARLDAALDRLDLLAAVDCLPTETVTRADIVIPALTVFESGGTYINQEGRAGWSQPAHAGGTPVRIEGSGGHPPRLIRPDIPAGDIPSAWQTAFRLAGLRPPAGRKAMNDWMAETFPVLEPIRSTGVEGDRIFPASFGGIKQGTAETGIENGGYLLVFAAAVFGDEPMSAFSQCLEECRMPQELWMAESDAGELGGSDGDSVRLDLRDRPLEFTLRTSARVVSGVFIVYRHTGLQWRQFDPGRQFTVSSQQVVISGTGTKNTRRGGEQ